MPVTTPLWRRIQARIRPPTGPQQLFTQVRQVCTVVEDFETTITNLVEQLGIGPFKCWYWRPPALHRTTFRGQPADWTMKLGITWLGDLQYEVITPMEGATLYREHLDERGRGVQHILMETAPTSFDEAAVIMAQRGHPFAQTAAVNPPLQFGAVTLPAPPSRIATPMNLQFGYVDAGHTLRTDIEMTRYPLGFTERFALRGGKAEFCIPEGDSDFERSLPNRRVRRVVKVGIVTRDLDATVRAWREVGGVGPWHLFEREAGRIAWALVDEMLIELVEPSGASPYQDVLEQLGEGVATLGVEPNEGLKPFVARCEGLGYACLHEGALVGDYPSAYLGARAAIGTDLEVVAGGERMLSLFGRTEPDRVVG